MINQRKQALEDVLRAYIKRFDALTLEEWGRLSDFVDLLKSRDLITQGQAEKLHDKLNYKAKG